VLTREAGAALVERERAEQDDEPQAEEQAPAAVGEGPGWHWVSYVDREGWPLAGNEPCDCPSAGSHVEER
jgi:hypothetical protein